MHNLIDLVVLVVTTLSIFWIGYSTTFRYDVWGMPFGDAFFDGGTFRPLRIMVPWRFIVK